MRIYLLAAVATAAISTPALAQGPYVGIEGGILFPKDQDADVFVDFTTTQTPTTPAGPAGPADFNDNNAFGIDYKRGYDVDVIAGYDFGFFRLEGELGFKRARLDEFSVDNDFAAALNAGLNRPSAAPDTGAPGQPALVGTDFDLDGKVKVRSYMLNALLDFGDEDGLSFYAGVGAGRARVKFAGDSDGAWAGQLIAGARYALSDNVDIGLKYRYFRTGKINLAEDTVFIDGNPNTINVGTPTAPVFVDQTTDAALSTDFEQKFRSHSILASLIFNFGGERAPPPPPPYVAPTPPPPPPPPATQTCADGSVIMATDICPPAPEPYTPPPAPEPAPERG